MRCRIIEYQNETGKILKKSNTDYHWCEDSINTVDTPIIEIKIPDKRKSIDTVIHVPLRGLINYIKNKPLYVKKKKRGSGDEEGVEDEILMHVKKCPKCNGTCKEKNTNRDTSSYGSRGEYFRNCSNCSNAGIAFGYLLNGIPFSLNAKDLDKWRILQRGSGDEM